MLHMISGCQVPDSGALQESFEQKDKYFYANLHAEHIDGVMRAFLLRQTEELFFFLELPTPQNEEKKMREEWKRQNPDGEAPLHRNVYYWDGITLEQAFALLDEHGELLIQDGMSFFGFGVRSFSAEIQKWKYNLVTLFAREPERYRDFFPGLGIPEREELTTAWDTFSPSTPGDCIAIRVGGRNVFDLAEELKPKGLYFAQRREEKLTKGRKTLLSNPIPCDIIPGVFGKRRCFDI